MRLGGDPPPNIKEKNKLNLYNIIYGTKEIFRFRRFKNV